MHLYMFHGRNTPTEQLEDWGFDGPKLGGVKGFHVTYNTTYRVVFADETSFRAAQIITGWRTWDELSLEMEFDSDLCVTHQASGNKYYGDWGFSL